MNEDIFERNEFKCIEKEKIDLIKKIASQVKGKSAMEAMTIFMTYQDKLSEGRPLSDLEKAAVIMALKDGMTEAEKKKFNMVMNMIAKMNM